MNTILLPLGFAAGIGAVVLDRTDIFLALKTFGILYLAFISLALLRSADQNGVAILSAPDRSAADSSSVFMRSFVVAVTNPKAWLFFSAVLPQFIAAEAELSGQVLVLTGLVVAIDTVVLFGYVLLGSHLSRWLEERRGHWIDRISGVLLLTIAAGLALEHLWSS